MVKKITPTFLLILSFLLAGTALSQDPGNPDTARVECLQWVTANSQVVLNVYLYNDSVLGGFAIPLAFPDTITNLDVTCDSISRVGTRSQTAFFFSDSTSVDNDKNRLIVVALWSVVGLPPGDTGDGPVAKIYFTTGPSWDSSQFVQVDSTFWPPNSTLTFAKLTGEEYTPAFIKGCLGTGEWPSRNDTLFYFAYSPVDLIVTAPNGDSIGVDFNTITNATYDTTIDKNHDGDLDDVITIPDPIIGEYKVRVVREAGVSPGDTSYSLGIRIDGSNETVVIANASVPPPNEVDTVTYDVMAYLRGDANSDGKKTVSDAVFLINYLFKGGAVPNPLLLGDTNCCQEGEKNCQTVSVSVSDVVYLVNYLFKGGLAPCS